MTAGVDDHSVGTRRRAGLLVLLGSHGLSTLGEAMTVVAVPWFVLQTTGSIARTGAVVAVAGVAAAVTGFLAGPLVDKFGFKRFAVLGYLASGAGVGAVVLLHWLDLLTFLLLLLLVVLATASDAPRRVAVSGLVPSLAREAGTPLERANSALRATSALSALVGPALGGVASAFVGAEKVMILDALSCLLAALLLSCCVRAPRAGHSPPEGTETGALPGTSTLHNGAGYMFRLRDGVRHILRTPLLRWLLATGMSHNLLDSAMSGVILVGIAHYWWGDAASFGALVSAIGIGALAGTVIYGAVGPRLPRRPVFVGGTLALAVPVMLLATAPPFGAALGMMVLFGLVSAPRGPLLASALQEAVPTAIYGRVLSGLSVVTAATGPVGIGLAAGAVSGAGMQPTIGVISLGYLIIGAVCWRTSAFRKLDTVRQRHAPASANPST